VAIPLIVAEVHNAIGLELYAIALWDVDCGRPRRPPRRPVDVSAWPCSSRPITSHPMCCCRRSQPRRAQAEARDVVLDDGRRDDIRELAETLGARYLTRPTNEHAKAGNLNPRAPAHRRDIIGVLMRTTSRPPAS
jgi:hypothetical protein